jgi:hypothetical protein
LLLEKASGAMFSHAATIIHGRRLLSKRPQCCEPVAIDMVFEQNLYRKTKFAVILKKISCVQRFWPELSFADESTFTIQFLEPERFTFTDFY